MTKIKKRLALMMVLVMTMTMLALPASADTPEEEVTPYVVVIACANCGGNTYKIASDVSGIYKEPKLGHEHHYSIIYDLFWCSACDKNYKVIKYKDDTAHCTVYPKPCPG